MNTIFNGNGFDVTHPFTFSFILALVPKPHHRRFFSFLLWKYTTKLEDTWFTCILLLRMCSVGHIGVIRRLPNHLLLFSVQCYQIHWWYRCSSYNFYWHGFVSHVIIIIHLTNTTTAHIFSSFICNERALLSQYSPPGFIASTMSGKHGPPFGTVAHINCHFHR